MKKWRILAALAFTVATCKINAQVIDDTNGKTFYYYDSISHKKVKEIYHHIQEFRTMYDRDGNVTDTILHIKNGPYTRYFENGKLECSGFYNREKKNGTWLFYDRNGKHIRTEQWENDKLVSSVKTAGR